MEGDRDHRSPFPFLRVMGTHTTAFFRTRNSSPFFHGRLPLALYRRLIRFPVTGFCMAPDAVA